jgi:hypothetical protein
VFQFVRISRRRPTSDREAGYIKKKYIWTQQRERESSKKKKKEKEKEN